MKHNCRRKEEDVKLVSNFESYATQKVTKLVQALGNSANPHDQCETSVAYLGNNTIITDLTTWRQPGKHISDMHPKQLRAREDRIKLHKYADSPKFESGKGLNITTSASQQENLR